MPDKADEIAREIADGVMHRPLGMTAEQWLLPKLAPALRSYCTECRDEAWQPIETVPEGEHIQIYWPKGPKGIGAIECATIFRGDVHSATGMSFWTAGGPNGGIDWEPYDSEMPTYWRHLPAPPQETATTPQGIRFDQCQSVKRN